MQNIISSMENFGYISEPQVVTNEQNLIY